ncbi:MAG TPA: hypothetical protein VKY19_13855 [Ktedonosporobacter sp.]|jgi:hypothetical protein|nr:hypothetical protein [Ktedonosporobacter sp.]
MHNPQLKQEIILPVTHLEAITINAAINMTLRFNTYLPPESQAILQEIQRRILQHIAPPDKPDRA